ncbi:toll-like receptor 13 [Lingula anatina]|uniref:Toll-like receptor 13 n=1 Tax=Lingula anatina TaxID=7574 RepID=A0A1S3HG32_LINAN|nr:toll-like receptor 13 [Lingula anatina]|eukprot:XP_013383989.1 toll-like receptor 13 [Lingula anatina]
MTINTAIVAFVLTLTGAAGFYCPPRCHCKSSLRQVECHNLNSTQVPHCDNTTLILVLNDVWISSLRNDSFAGLSELENLTLSSNTLSHVEKGAFEPLENILSIDLKGKLLSLDNLESAFCHVSKTIQRLCLNRYKGTKTTEFQTPRSSLFLCLNGSDITELDLSYNSLHTLPVSFFSGLTKLQNLILRDNHIAFRKETFVGLNNLRLLDLRNNHLSQIPNFGNVTHPFCPNLLELHLAYNDISSLNSADFISLKYLKRLDIGWNLLTKFPNNMFGYMPELQFAFLQHQRNLKEIQDLAFASASLFHLDISINNFQFNDANSDVFSHAPHLQELYMSDNHLDKFDDSALEKLFRNLTKLRKLIISQTRLTHLPPKLFETKPFLRELQLGSNQLSSLDPVVFQSLFSLQMLYLENNLIRTIYESSLPPFVWKNLTKISLAENLFSCTCDNFWFRTWMDTTQTTIVALHQRNSYRCYEPKELAKSPFLDWHPTKAQCTPLPAWVIASATGVSAMLFLALVIVVSHRYRWYIRYWCFTLRSRYKRLEPFENNGTFVFDAFVSYNSYDRHWVIQRLLPKLEHDAGFKLCLHDRDFIVGHDILDNIVDALEVSRKTILVLSNNFAQSQWCQLEMTMAHHKLFDENKDILVLILLEDIKPENLSNRLTLLLRKQTYIEWPREEEGQDLFWERVKAALQRPPGYEPLQ